MKNLVKMTSRRATKEEIDTLLKAIAKMCIESEEYKKAYVQDADQEEIELYLFLKVLQKSVTKIVLKTPHHTKTYFQFLTVFTSAQRFVLPEIISIQNMLFQQTDNIFTDLSKQKKRPIF